MYRLGSVLFTAANTAYCTTRLSLVNVTNSVAMFTFLQFLQLLKSFVPCNCNKNVNEEINSSVVFVT